MTILQAIRAAVETGKLQEPFTARDVAAALEEHHFSYGSLQASLTRYSRRRPDPPMRQVARGRYQLTRRDAQRRREPADRGAWARRPVPEPAGPGPGMREGVAPHFEPRRRIRVTLRGKLQASRGAPVEVRVRNLSLRGAMIVHENRLVPGRSWVLNLGLPGRDLRVPAQVIWSQATGTPSGPPATKEVSFFSGLHFLSLAEPIEIRLRDFLVTLTKSPSSAVLE